MEGRKLLNRAREAEEVVEFGMVKEEGVLGNNKLKISEKVGLSYDMTVLYFLVLNSIPSTTCIQQSTCYVNKLINQQLQ